MKLHVIAYRSLELLFGTHTFHFNCFFDDFNCLFTQIRCLSRVLEGVFKNQFSLISIVTYVVGTLKKHFKIKINAKHEIFQPFLIWSRCMPSLLLHSQEMYKI